MNKLHFKNTFGLLFFFFGSILNTNAQVATTNDADYIKTISVRPLLTNVFAPFIKLNETLAVSFDDLNADMQEYTYQITHCDFDWNPTNLTETEYIVGYANDRIRNYETSFNTLQPYVHYQFQIPNQNTRIRITGNYLISVLNEDEEIVFSRKFVIYQNKTNVGVSIHRGRSLIDRQDKQSVQFTVYHPNLRINNPSQEIKTVLLQNNDWKTAITDVKPQFIRGDQLLYKYDKQTSFWAGNEFLFFDSKSIRTAGPNIHSIKQGEDLYETLLYTDEERKNKPYTLDQDINGNFVVRILNGDGNLEADYTWVHFSLAVSEENKNKTIFVNGNFNDWQLINSNKMMYNKEAAVFEAKILLKQGFYNYNYVSLNTENLVDPTTIDGSFYQTENEYTVLVYYRKTGSRYQEIIGLGKGNSINIRN